MKLSISSSSSSSEHSSGPSSNQPFPDGIIFLETNLRIFTLAELKAATGNFRGDSLLGEGGFGKVFKGLLDQKNPLGERKTVIAVKKLNRKSVQGFREWKVVMHHDNVLSMNSKLRPSKNFEELLLLLLFKLFYLGYHYCAVRNRVSWKAVSS